MYDIIIIGGGPCGLTAALYALRAEKSVLILERLGLGGQIALSESVENFPGISSISGQDFTDNLSSQVEAFGGEIRYENVTSIVPGDIKTVVCEGGEYRSKAVIIATGLKNRRLGAHGEDLLIGRGVSFCAVCDGRFFKGKNVAVIGGGNTAVEEAKYLSNIANKVFLIHRRDRFRAEEWLLRKLKECKNVEFILDTVVDKFCGENKLSGLDLVNQKTKEKQHIEVDGAFIAVGQVPQNESFKDLISLSPDGYALSGEDCTTNHKGIFVAGDCRNKEVRQLTTAVGDGSVAALNACKFLEEESI